MASGSRVAPAAQCFTCRDNDRGLSSSSSPGSSGVSSVALSTSTSGRALGLPSSGRQTRHHQQPGRKFREAPWQTSAWLGHAEAESGLHVWQCERWESVVECRTGYTCSTSQHAPPAWEGSSTSPSPLSAVGAPSSLRRAGVRSRRRGLAAQARGKREEREVATHSPSVSPASLVPASGSVKFSRLDSTLPLSPSATRLKAWVRVLYSLVTHGALAAFGCLICHLAGFIVLDTMQLDSLGLGVGLLLSLPPILVASLLYLDPVVDAWEVARGVRDAEDEELQEYYLGMTPLQYVVVAGASGVAQEVFFRAALQGGLALVLHLGGTAGLEGNILQDLGAPSATGMAAVSGYFPAFAPFSQLHAAVVMAAITGSFDYATSLRSVPSVIVADGRHMRTVRATFGEWYQRQQLKSIYAPMFTALLAFYFGLEWILVGNLLAPIVSHSLFLAWSMHFGLRRLQKLGP